MTNKANKPTAPVSKAAAATSKAKAATSKAKAAQAAAPAPQPTSKPAPVRYVPAAAVASAMPTTKLQWLVTKNAKRVGTGSFARAEQYWGAATVADYKAKGGSKEDLRWDVAHGYVALAQ